MAKARILLVEDNQPQADITREFLERNGYEVVWAKDGTSAIKAVKTSPIDVILLDLILPDINGNEVCRWLKVNNETKGIPIIMLTVKSSLEDKVTSIEAGADDFLPKPYNEIELNATIYAALRTKAFQDELREWNKQLEVVITKRNQLEEERKQLIIELKDALDKVKVLSGLLPICAWCKKIRDDKGYWNQIEMYISKHSEAVFSHGMCPECFEKFRIKE
jgi:DNA-binding response OmpR family regulator